jgi:hypothetical protein
LGDRFLSLRSQADRRSTGAVYTPLPIVRSMVRWLRSQGELTRIVDPGAGSGRYTVAAARAFPAARLVAVEQDPLAALLLRANLAVLGLAGRSQIIVDDFRNVALPVIDGRTGFIGNPPYVRHHQIDTQWKTWYAERFADLGIKASRLAGLHLHFFLKAQALARPGDVGAFITSAEWLDVNYGAALRRLLVDNLGLEALHVLEPAVEAFPGTATTAAIACFNVGARRRSVKLRDVTRLTGLNGLSAGKATSRASLRDNDKWSSVIRPLGDAGADRIELGELFGVHRGQVTGKNSVWIAGAHARTLPARVRYPTITRARELFSAGAQLGSTDTLRHVIDLPADLAGFDAADRRRIRRFLGWARSQGADTSYIATHRQAWWSVGLRAPAPILCTYMARWRCQWGVIGCVLRS